MVLPSLILRLEQLVPPGVPHDAPPTDEPAPASTANPSVPETAASEGFSRDFGPDEGDAAASQLIAPVASVVDVTTPERTGAATPLSRWSAAVAGAHDACFVVDAAGAVVSISVAAVELLGCGDGVVIGRPILDVVNPIDLDSGASHPEYAARLTPLAVLTEPGLARSFMRVRHPDGGVVTIDSSSAPVHDVNGRVLGSVTFIAAITAH
jgi:PAS domain S-box-containing protein